LRRSTLALQLKLSIALALAAPAAPPAHAFDLRSVDVAVNGNDYRVTLDAVVNAPVERVARVLTDYAGYVALDPRIRSSEVIDGGNGRNSLIRTSIRACIGPFCRTVERVERVAYAQGRLVAEALPERSDLQLGVTRTEWRAEGDGTRIRYRAEFQPDVWVPEFVARRYVAGTLRESVLELFQNVEARARVP
jgi:hypothetical protein